MIPAAHQTMLAPLGGSSAMRCAVFDGTNSSVMWKNVGSFNTGMNGPISVALWCNVSTNPSQTKPMFAIQGTTAPPCGMKFDYCVGTTKNIRVLFQGVGSYPSNYYPQTLVGDWHHYAFSFDYANTAIKIYCDGSQIYTNSSVSKWINATNTLYAEVGGEYTGNATAGKIANVGLWNRALSASEVANLALSMNEIPTDADHQWLFADDDGTDTGTATTKWNLSNGSTTTFEDI